MMGWLENRLRGTVPETIAYTDPLHSGRHPFQTFMLALCLVSSLPLLFGQETSSAVDNALPEWLAIAWGLSLLIGSAVALLGSFWPGDYDVALLLERMGLDVSGCAALVYASIVFAVAGWGGLVAGAIVLGFGASCLTRARDIARIFARATQLDPLRVREENDQ